MRRTTGGLWWGRSPRAAGPTERVSEIMGDWEEEQFLMATRRAYLFGEVDDEAVRGAVQRLQRLAAESADPVNLYISSDGGYVDAGLALIDQIAVLTAPVTTIVAGRAYSMGAVIAAFGSRGRRFVMPNASIMLHPLSFEIDDDYVEQHAQTVQFIRECYARMLRLLAKRMRTGAKALAARIDKGLWLTPEAAVRCRLADGIWTAEMEAQVNRRAASAGRQGKGRLAQISKMLRVLSDGIENNEELEVEREP